MTGTRAPSKALWAAELSGRRGRSPRGGGTGRHRAAMRAVPRGYGRPVVLLPGLFNADGSNMVVRAHLRRLGYRAEGCGLARNLGALAAEAGR